MGIVFISPYPELSELAEQICREQGKSIMIYTAVLGEGLQLARRLEREEKAGVIVSRGATGALIRSAVNVPVIMVEITPFDVAETLYKARSTAKRVAFFDHFKRRGKYDFQKISAMLGMDIKLFYYRDEKELSVKMKEAALLGCEAVVASGVCIVKEAEAQGLKGIMINSSKEALQEAFARAEETLMIRKKDRQITERLKTILNHSYGGIIAVDNNGTITHFNPKAEEILDISAEEAVGRNISDFKEEKDLQSLYSAADPVLGDFQFIKDSKYIVSRIPLKLDTENFGTIITFQEVQKIQKLEAKIRQKLYSKGLLARYSFDDIIGKSPAITHAISRAKKYSKTEATVLITGESGTGKELFAHSIHRAGRRSEGPFVAINCAAIPENLLESELFGYEEGAFTGAKKGGNPGLFEAAHGGTLFLDEILELPLPLQARLLRVLQEKAVRRIGGKKVIPVDVRIISATNRDLRLAVKEGRFREDLFFRLNVLNLKIPPLRERISDIPLLVEKFLKRYAAKYKNHSVSPIGEGHMNRLKSYSWPGNVRELENFVEKYVILSMGEENSYELLEELLAEMQENDSRAFDAEMITVPLGTLKQMEAAIIAELAARGRMDKGELASRLGVSRTTIWKRLKESQPSAFR